MEHDDVHIAGDFFLHQTVNEPVRPKRFYERFQHFFHQETMAHIQHCLLRIPFILLYDYLFTEQFSSLMNSFFNYSVELFDRENRLLLKPITLLLHTDVFQTFLQMNVLFSLPVGGK